MYKDNRKYEYDPNDYHSWKVLELKNFSKQFRKFSTSTPWIITAFVLGIANLLWGNEINLVISFILFFLAIHGIFWRVKQKQKSMK